MSVTDVQVHLWESEHPDRPWPKPQQRPPHRPNGFSAEEMLPSGDPGRRLNGFAVRGRSVTPGDWRSESSGPICDIASASLESRSFAERTSSSNAINKANPSTPTRFQAQRLAIVQQRIFFGKTHKGCGAVFGRGIRASRRPKCGLIVPPAALATHRDVIIKLAARYRLPAIYPLRIFVTEGGLMSYGPATTSLYPRVADYIDRILKGTKPGDLPVQPLAKTETVLNAKTAMGLGLTVPETLLSTADEVIQ